MATPEMTARPTALGTTATVTTVPNYTRPLTIVTTLFFMWGFITSLNDILVPHLKSIFDLSYAHVMLIQFAFFSAYFLFSIPWAKVVNVIGYQKSMVAGLLCMTVGAFLFVPAASSASFPLFLAALIVLAAGITGLQVAANPYVVVLGKPSPQALHLYRVNEAASVKMPYIVIGIALLLLAVMIALSKLPTIAHAEYRPEAKVRDSVWKHPNLVLGALGIFAYVGAEVSIGSFLVNYFSLPDIAGLSAKTAAGFVSFYWGGAMVGRFLGAAVLRRIRTGHLLALCAICTAALVVISMLSSGHIAMWSSRTWAADRKWFGHSEYGDRRRRDHAPYSGRDCRSHRNSSCILHSRDLLLVHSVLCTERIEAKQRALRNSLGKLRSYPC